MFEMDDAGLIIGVVTAWKTCTQVLDLVIRSGEHGTDPEPCKVKLDVERVRLLAWGDAVGLNATASLDARLQQQSMQEVVLRVLGGIQTIFDDADNLDDRYGLIEYGLIEQDPSPDMKSSLSLASGSQKAATGLEQTGKQHQQTENVRLQTLWVVHDRAKFLSMVVDIRSINDSLRDLFPDLGIREAIRKELRQLKSLRELSLLLDAAGINHDVSDIAGEVLEEITGVASVYWGPLYKAKPRLHGPDCTCNWRFCPGKMKTLDVLDAQAQARCSGCASHENSGLI